MNFYRIIFAVGLMFLGREKSALAQPTPGAGENLTVYLMTMGPGDAIFEKFGHTAIWIRDADTQSDIAYNWGLFDFNESDFIARLAKGRMRYSMAGFEMQAMLQEYTSANRSVWVQELNLTPEQKLRVRELAQINALPENRFYTYDYYLNNCSTRPRDLIDQVLGGRIKARTDSVSTGATFRTHTLRILGDDILPYAGAQFALGHPADKTISAWEEMFLPLKLQEHIRKVSVVGKSGAMEPLVAREFQMAQARRPAQRSESPNYIPRFFLYGIGIAAVLLILLSLSLTGLRSTKALLGVFASLISIIGGLTGLALILAWTISDHVFMARNENVLQLSPLLLVLGLMLPFAFKLKRVRRPVIAVAFASASLSAAGLALQLFPMFRQPNGEIIALALPVQFALALVCWFLFSDKRVRL